MPTFEPAVPVVPPVLLLVALAPPVLTELVPEHATSHEQEQNTRALVGSLFMVFELPLESMEPLERIKCEVFTAADKPQSVRKQCSVKRAD